MNDPEIMSFEKKGRYEESSTVSQKERPRHKMTLLVVVVLLGLEFINLTLWQLGAIPSVQSVFVSEIMTCVISFFVGRVYEKFCK